MDAQLIALVSRSGGTILADKGRWIHRIQVRSSSSNNLYVVSWDTATRQWGCSCPGWAIKRGSKPRSCKHVTSMLPVLNLIENPAVTSRPEPTKPRRTEPAPRNPAVIPAKRSESAPDAIMDHAKSEVRRHLPVVAEELLTWRKTGLLPDGKLREIAEPLKRVAYHDYLSLAEKLAVDAALEAATVVRSKR